MDVIVIEVAVTIAGIFGGMFGLVRYTSNQNTKREDRILKHHESQQEMMLGFYEKKNGHLERITQDFAKTNRESTEKTTHAMNLLTTEIKMMRKSS